MTDLDALEKLLRLFFAYERPEIADFRESRRAVLGRSARHP